MCDTEGYFARHSLLDDVSLVQTTVTLNYAGRDSLLYRECTKKLQRSPSKRRLGRLTEQWRQWSVRSAMTGYQGGDVVREEY